MFDEAPMGHKFLTEKLDDMLRVSSVSAHQHILEKLFPNETAALRAHRFRTKSDFHVESLAFNIALNSKILQLDGEVAIGRA